MDDGAISLSWEIEGAQLALLEIYAPQQLAQGGLPEPPEVTQDGLPTSGSTSVTLPSSLNSGARIILWAANLSTEARSPASLYERLAYRIIDIEGDQIDSAAEITAFIALPPAAPPGSEVTLSWNIRGAESGLIELYDLETGSLVGIFEDLPPIGSANIVIPAGFTQGVRFVLWATNQGADGDFLRLAQAEVEVLPG
jgi:hypothetical protein